MKKFLMVFVCLMTMIMSVNGQNEEKYTPNDVRNVSMEIGLLKAEAKVSNHEKIEHLKQKRDYMVNTFSKEDKTIRLGENKDSVIAKLSICGWWSKKGTFFNEGGKIEKIYFESYYLMYVGEDVLDGGRDYEFTFLNGKLKNIDTAKDYIDRIKQEINQIEREINNIDKGIGLVPSPKKEKKKTHVMGDDVY